MSPSGPPERRVGDFFVKPWTVRRDQGTEDETGMTGPIPWGNAAALGIARFSRNVAEILFHSFWWGSPAVAFLRGAPPAHGNPRAVLQDFACSLRGMHAPSSAGTSRGVASSLMVRRKVTTPVVPDPSLCRPRDRVKFRAAGSGEG